MAEKQYDPWPIMAVEKQFHEINGNQDLPMNVPATLTWLQTEGQSLVLPKARWAIDERIQELEMAFIGDHYAESLTEMLWGEGAEVNDWIAQRLTNPEADLINSLWSATEGKAV